MFTNTTFSIITATIYLLVYCVLLQVPHLQWLAMLMFAFSPLVLCWMVYVILKYGRYTGRELAEDEEYGYGDRDKCVN